MRSTIHFLLNALKPYKLYTVGLILIEIFWAFDLSIRPYLIKVIIDKLETMPHQTETNFFLSWPIIFYITLSILGVFIFRLSDYIYLKMVPLFRNNLILKSFKLVQRKNYKYFQSHFGGAIATKIGEMADAAQYLINLTIYRFLAKVVALLIACYVMGRAVHPYFAIILITGSVLFIFISYMLTRKPYKYAMRYLETYATFFGNLVDSISNILAAILFARRKYELSYLSHQAKVEAKASQELQWIIPINQFLVSLFLAILISVILIYLVYLKQRSLISIGDIALTLTITIMIANSLQDIVHDSLKFFEMLGKCSTTITLIQTPDEIIDFPRATPLKVTAGKIEFRNVTFSYVKGTSFFNNLSTIIQPQQKVGLIGHSGSGKTTFVNLILRLFEIDSGAILIDGQKVNEVTQNSLHESISFIPQDPLLFNRSIYENIAYGNPQATKKDITKAARLACADEFIEQLPEGYNTVAGERGVKLSGGQRQRIAIARALLKPAKIIILDEISSELDPITEYYLQKSLSEVIKDKTVLAISHRLSTLIDMDRILVFEHGAIVEDGHHDILLKRKGVYYNFWEDISNNAHSL